MPQCLNVDSCPCEKLKCERHGRCCACVSFHASHPEKPVVHCLKYKVETYKKDRKPQ